MRREAKKKSFTLIELLIALIIISITATLAIPGYKQYIKKAKGTEAKQVLRALADSLWRYHSETGGWPPSSGGQIPAYLDTQPPKASVFSYEYSNNGEDGCQLSSYLPNAYKKGYYKDGESVGYAVSYAPKTFVWSKGHSMDGNWNIYYLTCYSDGLGDVSYRETDWVD